MSTRARFTPVTVHAYDDLVARSNHREYPIDLVPGETATGAQLVERLEELLGLEPGGAMTVLRNGRPWRAAELAGVDVDPGDEFHAAARPGEPVDVVLIAIAIASAVASAAIALKTPRPTTTSDNAEKRYGFNRVSSDAYVGDAIPVLFGRRRRYGGKVIAKIPVESADGSGDAKLRMLICLGWGPIQSIAGQTSDFTGTPAASIDGVYLNDQPISSFPGAILSGRLGTQGQAVIPGFSDVETLHEVGVGGVDLRNTSGVERTGGSDSGEAFTYTTQGPVNAAVVRVRFASGLYTVRDSGQVDTRRVKYRYRSRLHAGPGAWSAWTVVTLERSDQSEFFSSPRLDNLAAGGGAVMDIELERVSVESSSAGDVDKMTWDSVVESLYSTRTYPGLALLALELTAGEQLQGVPRVSADVQGLKVRVWDGVSPASNPTFAAAYSENPAYHALELLTNKTWGLGATYGDANVNMASLIAAAQYADTTVQRPGGAGTRPRYRFHFAMDQQRDGIEWLRTVCNAMDCVPTTSGGVWSFPIDRAQASPVEVFTDGSIAVDESGLARLRYTRELSTRGLVRPNRLVAQLENEQVNGQPDMVAYPDYGQFWLGGAQPEPVREEQVRLDGVTDPDQVFLWLLHKMNRTRYLTRGIRFVTTKPAVVVQPGDRFDVAMNLVGWGLACGRLQSGCTTTALRLDRTVTLAPGKTYAVTVSQLDNSVETRAVVSPAGTYPAGTPIALASALAQAPAEWAEYSVGESGIQLKPFTCVAVRLADAARLEWEIEGLEYAAGVYSDTPGPLNLPNYSSLPNGSTPPGPVTDLRAFERRTNDIHQIVLSWNQTIADRQITAQFRIYRRLVGTTAWILIPEARIAFRGAVIEIGEVDLAYEFTVVAVSYGGAYLSPYDPSVPIVSIVLGLAALPPPPPAPVSAVNTGGNTYNLTWPAVDGAVGYQVLSKGFSLGGNAAGVVDALTVARTTDPILPGLELPPAQRQTFWVRSIGSNGRLSFTATGISVTSPVPAGQALKQVATLNSASPAALSNASFQVVGGETWLRLLNASLPGVWTPDAQDSGSLTLTELTIQPSLRNDYADPLLSSDPFTMPSIAADQWGILSRPPPVVGMLMPPWPDDEQTWLFEVRTHDGTLWSEWGPIAIGQSIRRTFRNWQIRLTMSRKHAPYSPALKDLVVVLTH